MILSDFVKIPQSFFCSKKNDSSLYKGAFDGQGRALSLRLCEIFNIVSTTNRKANSAPSSRELLSEAKLRELKRLFQIIKTPSVIFLRKNDSPLKDGAEAQFKFDNDR